MLTDKRIVLGVTGGIAAYKSAELCRLFVKAGAEVRVVMTAAAKEFISPLTFQTLSGHAVYDTLFADRGQYRVDHVGLAQSADILVIAPATANCLGKVASGIADDLLTTTIMASDAPVLFAPAMNKQMYAGPATQQNLGKLARWGYHFIGPEEGELACGGSGRGRMAAVDAIFSKAAEILCRKNTWAGRKVLITAGPTREPLDPVRYLSNYSSGKMGYALAAAAQEQGAEVILVSGPVSLTPPAGVQLISVSTAADMLQAVLMHYDNIDVVIKAAAVADYRPVRTHEQKMKKESNLSVELVQNPDILAELGRRKSKQILVGFAAETENLRENALDKLSRKNLDMIVANDLTGDGAGFDSETNIVRIYFADGRETGYPKMTKIDVARQILRNIESLPGF